MPIQMEMDISTSKSSHDLWPHADHINKEGIRQVAGYRYVVNVVLDWVGSTLLCGSIALQLRTMRQGERCKILLLGESAVGKTSLFRRYIGESTERVTPTIGVQYKQKVIDLGGKLMKVQLWDTAGTQRFRTITPIYYRNVDGVLLVFDITDRASFRSIQYWVDELKEKGEDGAELVLVGNKNDRKNDREVPREEAAEKAKELGIGYVEANSLSLQAARPAFQGLIEAIAERRQESRSECRKQSPQMRESMMIKLADLPKRGEKQNSCC